MDKRVYFVHRKRSGFLICFDDGDYITANLLFYQSFILRDLKNIKGIQKAWARHEDCEENSVLWRATGQSGLILDSSHSLTSLILKRGPLL